MLPNCAVDIGHAAPRFVFPKRGVDIYTCPTCGCIMADLEFVPEQYEATNYYTMALKTRPEIEAEWGFGGATSCGHCSVTRPCQSFSTSVPAMATSSTWRALSSGCVPTASKYPPQRPTSHATLSGSSSCVPISLSLRKNTTS